MIAQSGTRNEFGRGWQLLLLAMCLAPAVCALGDAPAATPPPAAPSTAAATTGPTTRGTEQILRDIDAAGKDLDSIFTNSTAFTNPAKRAAAAPKAIPILKHMAALADELNRQDEQGQMMAKQVRGQLLPMMLVFGDQQAQADAVKAAAGSDSDAARDAKCALLMSNWWKAYGDQAAQTKLLADATALAKSDPQDPQIAQSLMSLADMGATTPDLSHKLQDVVSDNMKGDFMDDIKQQIQGERKMEALVGKPMTLTGTMIDDKPFSTDQWKGKVILVDFWATWCGPCKEELPRVKQEFADLHGKGLEVLGVSNDMSSDDLKKFLAADPAMPWPQLFDSKAAGDQQWSPITTGFGITEIPTMFLIDKKGICRSVNARDDFEDQIPKLLAEQ